MSVHVVRPVCVEFNFLDNFGFCLGLLRPRLQPSCVCVCVCVCACARARCVCVCVCVCVCGSPSPAVPRARSASSHDCAPTAACPDLYVVGGACEVWCGMWCGASAVFPQKYQLCCTCVYDCEVGRENLSPSECVLRLLQATWNARWRYFP